jgi:hypothetical protein
MCLVATLPNESYFVVIGTYCHKTTYIATIFSVAIDPNPCSANSTVTEPSARAGPDPWPPTHHGQPPGAQAREGPKMASSLLLWAEKNVANAQ